MSDQIFAYLIYVGELIWLTLGAFVLCGFAVQLCSVLFRKLIGHSSDTVFDVTALVGTPVHELGHAAMCLIFGHRIERVKLWSPTAQNGLYGYVEHSYNRKNPWAQLGNLFIGMGPLFSGLGVVILMLWLCFPVQWEGYLIYSRGLLAADAGMGDLLRGAVQLLKSLPDAFREEWLRATVGALILLPVSLHVTLSWQDVKNSVGAFPIYLLMVAVFALVTMAFGVHGMILAWLRLANLRLWSLFILVIAFSVPWVCIGLSVRLIRGLIRAF
ncbi:MAG: hypothetical protein IJX62_07520 [Clostridia bacterium]|nr:hypothetical protein [Clostridia bacterium]